MQQHGGADAHGITGHGGDHRLGKVKNGAHYVAGLAIAGFGWRRRKIIDIVARGKHLVAAGNQHTMYVVVSAGLLEPGGGGGVHGLGQSVLLGDPVEGDLHNPIADNDTHIVAHDWFLCLIRLPALSSRRPPASSKSCHCHRITNHVICAPVGNKRSRIQGMALPDVLRDSLRLPIMGSPMFIVSGPELVIAQCKAGIVGAFPALNARPQAALAEWITRIKDELAAFAADNPDKKVAPFAVNQICHTTNERLRADVETCVEHEVPIIITSLRPPEDVVKAVHSYGGVVFHDIISQRHAEKAAEQDVDGLILVCAGAGGHAGPLSPFALLREVKEWFEGTIILSGAISDGWCVASARALGADLAYMGSRFIATEEANAQSAYKQMLIDSAAKDVIYTPFFTGVAGSYLKPSIVKAGLDPDALSAPTDKGMNFAGRKDNEAKAWVDVWGSGQGIGTIHDTPPVAELVDRIEAEYGEARAQLTAS